MVQVQNIFGRPNVTCFGGVIVWCIETKIPKDAFTDTYI